MIASAPGKIILFGEHAVVYGRHALVSAINRRCRVRVKRADEFRIKSQLGITGLDFEIHPYISFAIKRFSSLADVKGAEIYVESEIPVGSGLGSSAAVTVATLKALSAEFGVEMSNEAIFEMAKKVEIDVQGRASGIDPFISTYGGAWLFPERIRVDVPFSFFVVNLGKRSTAEMVSKVAKLRERHPEVLEKIFDAIDTISLEASKNMKAGFINELISINQSLLRAIGVSNPEIDELVAKFEKEGMAVKITGAGGGGCVFGIFSGKRPDGSIVVECETEGVKIENEQD